MFKRKCNFKFLLLLFLVVSDISLSWGQTCTLSVTKTDATCGTSNGSATATATTTSSNLTCNNTSPMNCSSGCTTTVGGGANSTPITTTTSSQRVCITSTNYTGSINMNGGTLVICGAATPSSLSMNNATIVINNGGSLTVNFAMNLNSGNTINNYGTFTVNNNSVNIGGAITNFNQFVISNGNLTLNTSPAVFTNNCYTSVSGTFTLNNTFTNNGKISVNGSTTVNGAGIISLGQRAEFISGGISLMGKIQGPASGNCALVKINGNSNIQNTSTLSGLFSFCDPNGVENNGLGSSIQSFLNCNCTATISACSYEWRNSSNAVIGTNASITNLAAGTYTVKATCGGCVQTSSVTITAPPTKTPILTVATSPSTTQCAGKPITFTASSSNTTITGYSWFVNNVQQAGQTSSTFTTSTLTNGAQVYARATSSETCLTSNPFNSSPVTITITPASPITFNLPATVCVTSLPITLSATPAGGTFSGTGVTGTQFSVSQTGTYSITYTAPASACVTTPTLTKQIQVTATQTPTVAVSQSPATDACFGNPLTLTATSSFFGTTNNFDWYVNGTIQPTHVNPFITNSLKDGDIVKVTVTSNAACINTNTFSSADFEVDILMTKKKPSLGISVSPKLPVNNGTSVTFTTTYSNAGNSPTIAWYKNGTLQSGATGNSFTTTVNTNDVVYYTLTPDPTQCVEPDTKISPSAVNINSMSYAGLEENLNATIYSTVKGKLYFLYFEKYQTGNLSYKIIDKTNSPIVTGTTIPKTKTTSDNYCEVDLSATSLVEGDTYVLEVQNDKDKKRYLRFKFER